VCAVLVCNGERTMAGVPGAARRVHHDLVLGAREMIMAARVVFVDGFSLFSEAGGVDGAGGVGLFRIHFDLRQPCSTPSRGPISHAPSIASRQIPLGNLGELQALAEVCGWEEARLQNSCLASRNASLGAAGWS
jgi:hypothetical protein